MLMMMHLRTTLLLHSWLMDSHEQHTWIYLHRVNDWISAFYKRHIQVHVQSHAGAWTPDLSVHSIPDAVVHVVRWPWVSLALQGQRIWAITQSPGFGAEKLHCATREMPPSRTLGRALAGPCRTSPSADTSNRLSGIWAEIHHRILADRDSGAAGDLPATESSTRIFEDLDAGGRERTPRWAVGRSLPATWEGCCWLEQRSTRLLSSQRQRERVLQREREREREMNFLDN